MPKGARLIGIDPKRTHPANPWASLATWFGGMLHSALAAASLVWSACGHTGTPYQVAAFKDTGATTSVRGGLVNEVYVDTGASAIQDGSEAFPFHDIKTAIAAAVAGQTVVIAPGTYTVTGTAPATLLVSKAGVRLRGAGCGGGVASTTTGITTVYLADAAPGAAQNILTVNTADFECAGIRFLTDLHANNKSIAIVAGGAGARFTDCDFRMAFAGSSVPAPTSAANCSFDFCYASSAATTTYNASTGTTYMFGCQWLGQVGFTGAVGVLVNCDLQYITTTTNAAVYMDNCHVANGVGCIFAGSGIHQLRNNVLRGSVTAVAFTGAPNTASSCLVGNVIFGGTNDILVATGINVILADFCGNDMEGGKVVLTNTGLLTCVANKTKHAGGNVDAYATIKGAIACAVAGDTVQIAPGSWSEVGIVAKAGVNLQGAGAGINSYSTGTSNEGTIWTGATTMLTVAFGCILRDIRFYSDANIDAVDFATAGTAFTAQVERCAFAGNGQARTHVGTNATVYFTDCLLGSVSGPGVMAFNQDQITATSYVYNCRLFAGTLTVSKGTLIVRGLRLEQYADISVSGASVLDLEGITTYNCGASPALTLGTTGDVRLVGSEIITTGVTAVSISAIIAATSVIANNVIKGATNDISVSAAVAAIATFQDNVLSTSGIVLAGGTFAFAGGLKRVGGKLDSFNTLAGAVASASAGDVIEVEAGSWAAMGTPTVSLTVRGRSRERTAISAGAGNPIVTVGADIGVVIEDCTLTGSIDINGAAAQATLRNCKHTGAIDLIAGTNNTFAKVYNSRLVGDATDNHPIRIAGGDVFVYLYDSYVKGEAAHGAVLFTILNVNLYVSHCTIMNGSLGANLPMEETFGGAQSDVVYHSHHSSWNTDPQGGAGIFSNAIAVAQRYECLDIGADY